MVAADGTVKVATPRKRNHKNGDASDSPSKKATSKKKVTAANKRKATSLQDDDDEIGGDDVDGMKGGDADNKRIKMEDMVDNAAEIAEQDRECLFENSI